MIGRKTEKVNELTMLAGRIESLSTQYAGELDSLRRQKGELEVALDRLREEKSRDEREIEHKLGLHRVQVESERTIMRTEAEAERLRAVEEARLAVREGNLDAERKRFEQEIEFRTKRFEEEAATLRNLTSQILERLPKVNVERTFSTVEHIGEQRPEISAGDD